MFGSFEQIASKLNEDKNNDLIDSASLANSESAIATNEHAIAIANVPQQKTTEMGNGKKKNS